MRTSRGIAVTCALSALALFAHWMGAEEERSEPAIEAPIAEAPIESAIDPQPEIEAPAIEAELAQKTPEDPALVRMEEELAEDPVGQQIPMLSRAPKEMQLETLRWLERVPEDKIVAAIPALLAERTLPMEVREEMARAIVGDLIRDLEEQGVAAPHVDPSLSAARLTSAVKGPILAPLGGGSDRGPVRP